jgi:hypothetical protein
MNRQRRFNASLLFLTTFYALVSLVIVTSGRPDLTAKVVSEVGTLVIFWLLLTFGQGIALQYLIGRLEGRVKQPDMIEPDRLTHYLALKGRLHRQFAEECSWDPVRNEFCYDFHSVEISLPRPIYKRVTAWSQARATSFSRAAEVLLIHALADDYLEQVTIDPDGLLWPKEEGGPS